ncbi:MAG: hypothetical protein EKK57_07270 [Proteobacteria bacterium]|nr:MAG: hypothetical protein EKK57_07270 [Pseudomonadota bacterium]
MNIPLSEIVYNPSKKVVRHTVRKDINREFISFDIEGWDEVSKLSKKVLTFQGRDFAFTGWNSDRNEIYFSRPLSQNILVATVKK